jgi:hypothetical protein
VKRLVLLALLLAPMSLGAQTLAPGLWRGVLSFPDAPILVTLTAARTKGKLTLELRPEGAPASGLGSIREERHRVRFRWALGGGTEFECTLSGRDDGRFEGHCADTVRGSDGKFLRVALAIWPDPLR